MSEAIAAEVRTICRRAAEPVRPGESVKAQLRRAWDNLGRLVIDRLHRAVKLGGAVTARPPSHAEPGAHHG